MWMFSFCPNSNPSNCQVRSPVESWYVVNTETWIPCLESPCVEVYMVYSNVFWSNNDHTVPPPHRFVYLLMVPVSRYQCRWWLSFGRSPGTANLSGTIFRFWNKTEGRIPELNMTPIVNFCLHEGSSMEFLTSSSNTHTWYLTGIVICICNSKLGSTDEKPLHVNVILTLKYMWLFATHNKTYHTCKKRVQMVH